ncbi:MAG: hypothetical protein M1836_007941 [Candelina mexicana]|nr:MAG: hypothetical protein M1836_007941 [Candelina mexicana]
MPALHLKIYGAESDYTSKNPEFVEASNKRVREMSDQELADFLEERRTKKHKAIDGGENKNSKTNTVTDQSVMQKIVDEVRYPTAEEIIADTIIAVSVNNSFASFTFRLQDYFGAEEFADKLRDICKNYLRKTLCYEPPVGAKYAWWSDEWIYYDLGEETDSFEFLLERVRKYDGSDGNCMVAMKMRLD